MRQEGMNQFMNALTQESREIVASQALKRWVWTTLAFSAVGLAVVVWASPAYALSAGNCANFMGAWICW